MSHAWRTYCTPQGRSKATEMGVELDTEFTESDIEYIRDMNSNIFDESDPENLRTFVLTFLKRLSEQDLNAFTWLYFYMETTGKSKLARHRKIMDGGARYTTTDPNVLIWNALSQILPPETYHILANGYYEHKGRDSKTFLSTAILAAIYKLPYTQFALQPRIEAWQQQEETVQQMLQGSFILEIDPWVIDKHTKQGRTEGKGRKEFVEEGAIVEPQDPLYYIEALETIYINS